MARDCRTVLSVADVSTFSESSWAQIEELRVETAALKSSATVQAAAQAFTELIARRYSSAVLVRFFAVVRFSTLPRAEQEVARGAVSNQSQLTPATRVLSLLGTTGAMPAWCDRRLSTGHRAIPLIDSSFVRGAPMIAKLLADLEVDLAGLDTGMPLATRRLLGGHNATFYVPDAQTEIDGERRHVIPAVEFVSRHHIRTVFGMGGSYVDGQLVIAIVFTNEQLTRLAVDRFPSLISNFKMATASQLAGGKIFELE